MHESSWAVTVIDVAGTAGNDGVFESRGVCIHPYADARSISRLVVTSLAWILVLMSVARVAVPVLEPVSFIPAVPLVLLAAVLALVCLTGMLCTPFAWLWAAIGVSRSAVIRVSNALWIEQPGGRSSFSLVSLTSARLAGSDGEIALKTDDGDVIRVRVDGASEAERLLGAIATARMHGTWSARLYDDAPSSIGRRLAIAVAALFPVLFWPGLSADLALALVVLIGAAGWVLSVLLNETASPSVLRVGDDGLAIQGEAAERFIPFRCIERVDETGFGVQLALRGGERLTLTIVPPRLLRDPAETGLSMVLAERRREHLLALLRERSASEGVPAERAASLLERRGRPATAWQAALRQLVSDAGVDYRRAKLTREQAFGVLEDGGAPAELRIGAALALSSADDGESALRVRIAAQRCANRDVRIALEQAAEGEIEESTLERALTSPVA